MPLAEPPAQGARELVRLAQGKVQRSIDAYNARPGASALTLNDVRQRFLHKALLPQGRDMRTLATAFISFFLEWDHLKRLLRLRAERGTAEPFFLHLFKGCLLFESLLKANPTNPLTNDCTLGAALQFLHVELQIPHNLVIGGVTFPAIVGATPGRDESLETAIEITGKVRNTVGHNLGWDAPLDATIYDELAGRVSAACLHAIARLYT